ncbi:MAG TPA: MOSC N-terminal beta barrel domain-containing protein, partial [Ktedonobacterales bacterium]|nr:MOSC N-terminal beta barrel domain-containing protein [Ktedonobacterales bacterium]
MADILPEVLGTVSALYRYPVKSMRGEALDEAEVTYQGVPGDRRYAFVQDDDRSRLPYLTARQIPAMVQYTAWLEGEPAQGHVMVRTPEGETHPIRSEALLADLAGRFAKPFHLLRLGHVGTYDLAPLSLISSGTVETLGAALGMTLDARRFRPTIYVQTPEGQAYPEDQWVGHTLVFGDDEVRMRATERDLRCKMITIDPETAALEPRVLREVVQTRQEGAGIYGTPEKAGILRVG